MSKEQQELRQRTIDKMVERMMNPAFQGRKDWLKRWNKKECRFETVDVDPIMMMMAIRQIKNRLSRLSRRTAFAPKGRP